MKKTKEELEAETATAEAEAKAKAEAEAKEKADSEAKAEAEAKVKAEADDKAKDKDKKDIDIDYKAEALKEREAREKAEQAAADNAYKLREERRKREEAEAGSALDDLDEDEKPLTRKDLDAILDKDRKDTTMSKAIEIVSNISGSTDEAELVMEVYKSRTFPAHLTLEDKLKEAYLIANAPKIIGQNAELKRALKGKNLSSKDGAGTHHDPPKSAEPQLSGADKTVLQQVGFLWNGTNRRFEKKLKNGQTLVREKDKNGKWVTRPLSA